MGKRKMYIMRGIPGSGKSTHVKHIAPRAGRGESEGYDPFSQVCSADDYFTGRDGEYRFDPARLGDAHGACFRAAMFAVQRMVPTVFIDNTNITSVECAPYVLLGQAYGYEVEILNIRCDPKTAAERCSHGVPADRIARMAEATMMERMPPWWTMRTA